jgi:hypothetical protein
MSGVSPSFTEDDRISSGVGDLSGEIGNSLRLEVHSRTLSPQFSTIITLIESAITIDWFFVP